MNIGSTFTVVVSSMDAGVVDGRASQWRVNTLWSLIAAVTCPSVPDEQLLPLHPAAAPLQDCPLPETVQLETLSTFQYKRVKSPLGTSDGCATRCPST